MPFVSYGGSSVVANFVLLARADARLEPRERERGEADVNKQITRLAVAAIVLITALIVGTTYWQTWAAAGLADRQDNALVRVAQFTVDRGKIYASDGHVPLATNVKRKVDGQTYYFRKYPNGVLRAARRRLLDAEPVARRDSSARENDYLTGANGTSRSVARPRARQAEGRHRQGQRPLLTLNSRAQQDGGPPARGKCGAAVAIEPQTGRILALASSPTYNPNAVEENFSAITASGQRAAARTRRRCSTARPRASIRRARRSRS